MAETKVIIDDYRVHPHTGHIEVDVHCHTVEGSASWDGPAKTYGFDRHIFHHQFNNDIEQLETYVAKQHRVMMGPPPGLVDALVKRKGKVIG